METIVKATRRSGVVLAALISVVVSLALVSAAVGEGVISRLPTLQLIGLLVLLILPIVTIGLLRLDQLTARERGTR